MASAHYLVQAHQVTVLESSQDEFSRVWQYLLKFRDERDE